MKSPIMKRRSVKRFVSLPLLAGLMGVGKSGGGFRPLDCEQCKWNHGAFGDDFPKSGHCYLFAEAPRERCGQRQPRGS